MSAATWSWRLLLAAGVILGLGLAGPGWAQEKGKKDAGKGKDDKNVIIIQLDLSKAPPGLVKQLMDLSKSTGKDDDKKSGKKDDDKKKDAKKGDEDKKKGDDKKSNIVQVDLNKLSPDLAKRLSAELAKSKGKDDAKKSDKKDDDDDKKKKGGKKDDDDDKGKGKKDDDDKKKGGKKKDD